MHREYNAAQQVFGRDSLAMRSKKKLSITVSPRQAFGHGRHEVSKGNPHRCSAIVVFCSSKVRAEM